MNVEQYLKQCQTRVNQVLLHTLPSVKQNPEKLHQAMHYSVLNGGKRLRSALIYAIGESLGANSSALDQCAVAIELVHSFSLIHDDLPSLDDDDLRRGKPACHIQYDEATAILAGDALLVLTFEVLSKISTEQTNMENILRIIRILSRLVGSRGMAGGELLDVDLEENNITLKELLSIYRLKTSYLICASILVGAIAANCNDKKILTNLEKFGIYLGLAFQIHDDIIGIESSSEILGKPKDTDKSSKKPTYPLIAGIDKAKKKEIFYLNQSYNYFKKSGLDGSIILDICSYVINRDH